MEIPSYNLIVIDEIESVLNHFNSSTFKGAARDVFDFLTLIISNSDKLITLDGDMGMRSNNFINSFGNSIYINNDIKINKRELNIIESRNVFNKSIYDNLDNDKKICIVSMSAEETELYKNEIDKHYNYKKVVKAYNSKTGDEEKDKLNNVNEEWLKADVVIFSPNIEAGVNFDAKHFYKIYGHSSIF